MDENETPAPGVELPDFVWDEPEEPTDEGSNNEAAAPTDEGNSGEAAAPADAVDTAQVEEDDEVELQPAIDEEEVEPAMAGINIGEPAIPNAGYG